MDESETRDDSAIASGRLLPSDEHDQSKASLDLPSVGDIEQLARANGSVFLVTDRHGDISPPGARELGLFFKDTRYLSHYRLEVPHAQIVWLSADITSPRYNQVDLMLSDFERKTVLDDPNHFVHIRRRQLLDGGLSEQISLTSFSHTEMVLELALTFGADFADIFEVRGARRPRRGEFRATHIGERSLSFAYDGTCGSRFETLVHFGTTPARITGRRALFQVKLKPGERSMLNVTVIPTRIDAGKVVRMDDAKPPRALASTPRSFEPRARDLEDEYLRFRDIATRWHSDDIRIERMLERSIVDIYTLRLHVGSHRIISAGIPWFAAPFGRDSLLTSYECLTLDPDLARDTLSTLAAFQGKELNDFTEEEPGKIFHELRFGEMVAAGEIPHSPYYGSVDATPLFVILADAHYRVTGDKAYLAEIAPAVRAALRWIDERSAGGNQLVTYERKTAHGLTNQGWKDSHAGVSFPDGRPAIAPIALVEVQGYAVDAYRRGARILSVLGAVEDALLYAKRAEALRELIEREMWLESKGRYAFAIDGAGHALDTVVSNLGHLLWSRIPSEARAASIAKLLLAPASFSGFGIRTVAHGQPVYNPLSYHNGTVWPHDNAIIARGFSNYGLSSSALRIFQGLYDAMEYFPDHRLPELFCGLDRADGSLVRYPVACRPQAWAAASPILLLQSMLGIHVEAPAQRMMIRQPSLPPQVHRLDVRGMRVGGSRVTLRFRNEHGTCRLHDADVTGAPLKVEVEL